MNALWSLIKALWIIAANIAAAFLLAIVRGLHAITLFLIALWFSLCAAVGALAKSRGRDATQWFAVAFLFSPLVAVIILALLPDIREQQIAEL